MADLDSDASSTSSDALLIVQPASTVKPDPLRYERCYPRHLLLQLSASDKIRPPAGLKPLSEWYGEYEIPSLNPVNALSNTANGRYAGRDGQTGGRRERERDRSAATAGGQADRYTSDREMHARSATGAPATGQMGDFKLAGQRPFTLPKDSDSGDALSAGNRRRQNLRDSDLRERGTDLKDRDWAAAGSNADRRRQLGGEFIKKDGRAAEEGGWRSSRETMQLGRDRVPRGDRFERPERSSFNDRDPRGPPVSSSDRRRQPAWMDDEEGSASTRHASSSAFQGRAQNGFQSNDASPAWMADEPSSAKGRPESSPEAAGYKPSTGRPASDAAHIDSIQAFKAQMKEMERRKKVQEDKEMRREMGLPELSDEHYEKKDKEKSGAGGGTVQATANQTNLAGAPKSVFADFLLPSSSTKEKEMNKTVEDKPRSSRFARMFAADAAASKFEGASSTAASVASPSQQSPAVSSVSQVSSNNSLLAALLPGASTLAAPSAARNATSPIPPTPQTDNQSMARLMEMLHMSSAPAHAQSPPARELTQPLNIAPANVVNDQNRSSPLQQDAGHRVAAALHKNLGDPRSRQEQPPQSTENPGGVGATRQQQGPLRKASALSSPQQVPQSRLAARSSGYLGSPANDAPNFGQGTQRQDQMPHSVPPRQPSVNLLDLLSGHATPPPTGPQPSNFRNVPLPQQQQQYQPQAASGQPFHAPPVFGHYPGQGPNIPDHQGAQMTAFLQGQAGTRPLGPPGVSSAGSMQYIRPSPGGYMPAQASHPPQHGLPPSQQHQHPSHMRSPSGHITAPASQSQEQQQRLPQNPQYPQQYLNSMRGDGLASQPGPPPQAFAQQNALAQLLAQGGHSAQQSGAVRSAPSGGLKQQQQQRMQSMPLPPMQVHQNLSPVHNHQSSQNQIDLMALLTGGGHGSGFAGR